METAAHRQLKRLAAAYLLRHGCQAVAMEVRCAIGGYRADVAGWIDAAPLGNGVNHFRQWADPQPLLPFEASRRDARREKCPPRVIVVECKQSRADFLRDAEEKEELVRERQRVEARLRRLEETVVRAREPELRGEGTFLFGEMEAWNFERSTVRGYQLARGDLKRIKGKLRGATKFWTLARYGVADRLYLMAPAGMIKRGEVPDGWGLLECGAKWRGMARRSLLDLSDESVRVTVEAPEQRARQAWRDRLLRNMAVALTRQAILGTGIGERASRYSPHAATPAPE